MTGIDLRRERYERDVEIINDDRATSSGMRTGGRESTSCQCPLYFAYTYENGSAFRIVVCNRGMALRMNEIRKNYLADSRLILTMPLGG